jgi:hypothetical protein
MTKEQTNELLKAKGVFCNSDTDEYIDTYRETYKDKMNKFDEEDFYNSMINWFFDGSVGASYYDYWLEKNWR